MAVLSGPAVNLPPIIFAHSIFLCFLGLYLVFRRPAENIKQRLMVNEAWGMVGIITFALGIAYLATSYMPIEDNQFLHASVPVRILLAGLAALRLLLNRGMTNEGRAQMWFVLLYDGFGGMLCGWQLGRWDGRIARW